MMTKTEQEEFAALKWAGVPEIPAVEDKKTPVWIYAIAKVTTTSNRQSYAIVRQDYGRKPNMILSFTDEGILRVDSVHPYKFLDANFVPKLENAAATKGFVAKAYGVPLENIMRLKKHEILRLFYMHCIKTQLESEKNNQN